MLDPETWYVVDQSLSTEIAVVIESPDGRRVVDAEHVELRSLLE